MNDHSLTPKEVAARLQISSRALADWRHKRIGPPYVKINHQIVRYPLDRLIEWEAARTVVARDARSGASK